MTINTTLDSFLYANTVGFNPDYGKITPRQSGSLISREINQNMEKLISIGHSIVITEDSETTAIEYNASFVVKTEDATLKLGTAFQGCQVTIVFTENGYIEYTKAEGNTKEKYKKNTIKKITYNGLYWIDTTPLQIPETNLTCDTAAEEEFKIVKIETILQQGKIPNNIELNIDFKNANSFGETTAATPTYPKLKITNAADEELGIYTICDSRGHYAGKGCWNSGDTMTFKIKGTKACITNSDVRETTSDYTIYSDGSSAYKNLITNKKYFIGNYYLNGYAEIKVRKSFFMSDDGQGFYRHRFRVLGHSGLNIRYCTVDIFWNYDNNLYYSVTQDNGDTYGQITVSDDETFIYAKINNPYCQRLSVINDSDAIKNLE